MNMNDKQEARLKSVLEDVKKCRASKDELKEFDGLKVVDFFNSLTAGAVAKLNVISNLFESAGGLPQDTPTDFIKYEAARLESVTREQLNGLCDCLLAVVLCNELEDKEESREVC